LRLSDLLESDPVIGKSDYKLLKATDSNLAREREREEFCHLQCKRYQGN
jgi:hypothetical protein